MEYINKMVLHKMFGTGKIINVEKELIYVDFVGGEIKKFRIDALCNGTLEFLNETDKQEFHPIMIALQEKEKMEKMRQEQIANEAKVARAKEAEIAKELNSHDYLLRRRTEGKVSVFLVCQNQDFEKEIKGGYLWAPSNNNRASHQEMKYVKKGDIIIHHFANTIWAVSVATNDCVVADEPCPVSRGKGFVVSVRSDILTNPTSTISLKKEKITYGNYKYGPFDKNGNCNQGLYLAEAREDLAALFIDKAIINNEFDEELLDIKEKIDF